jgi:hypothetical protein
MAEFEEDSFNRPIDFKPTAALNNLDRSIEFPAANDPTRETYLGWGDAFDFFNAELFGGELPHCLITYQRSRKYYGYFAADRFVASDLQAPGHVDEIAINPVFLHERPVKEALGTLVHEMAHLKRWRLISPRPTLGYHDKKWALVMIDIGLMPSDTGEPGGNSTGQKVSHYIVPGGRFDVAADELLRRDFNIRYVERGLLSAAPVGGPDGSGAAGGEDHGPSKRRARSAASKTPFSCLNCKPPQTAWAKPSANLFCGNCNTLMLGRK